MGYNIIDRECVIERPSFIGDMDKVICFIDLRLNLHNIKSGGRVIEYSAIKCSRNKVDVFHSIASPCYSIKNSRLSKTYDDFGIPLEVINGSRNTFLVFLDLIEFLSGVDIVICYDWHYFIRIFKFYLIELDLEIPQFWIWHIKYYINHHMKDMHSEFSTLNGFLRAYKTLLCYEYSGCKRMNEKSYVDYPSHGYWTNLDHLKIERFYKRLKKHNKWLKHKGRRGCGSAPWLAQYRININDWRKGQLDK